MLPDGPGAAARLVDSERVQFNRLVQHGAKIQLHFEALRGVTYAIMGQIPDDSDARISKLTIKLDHPDDGSVDPRAAIADGHSTRFGNDSQMPMPHLISTEEPSFRVAMSQPLTENQLYEDPFSEWVDRFATTDASSDALWSQAYVLQILEQHGMLEAGAKGLGISHIVDNVATISAARGCDVLVASPQLPQRNNPVADSRADGSAIEQIDIDLSQLPENLVDFDFLWSMNALDLLPAVSQAIELVSTLTDFVRPGGLAVHILSSGQRSTGDSGSDSFVFERGDIERIALTMVARGHEVARIRPADTSKVTKVAPFALVIRKQRSVI
jgi:hypothetical protein